MVEDPRRKPGRQGSLVALVNPQVVTSSWGRGRRPGTMEDALPRHSLTHLSACLKERGHRVLLVDLRLLDGWDAFASLLERERPEVVAITAHTVEGEVAAECCDRAKSVLPSCLTVGGGIHFTMEAERAPASMDFVVRGEGEIALPRLVEAGRLEARVAWGEPPDLDALPFEDRELWPDYAWRTRFPVWDLSPPTVDLLTGRGCPFACRFCCGPGEQNLFTAPSSRDPNRRVPSFRRRSVAHVLAEMRSLHQRSWVDRFQRLRFRLARGRPPIGRLASQ